MKEFLWHNKSIFARNISELGTTTKAEHLIDTGGSHPIKQLPRRLPNVLREEVNRQVGEMLDSGVIRSSKSPWASPIVLVKKKGGTWRFCVDFRKLNDVTVKDSFPLPCLIHWLVKGILQHWTWQVVIGRFLWKTQVLRRQPL